jgi:predicted flap endonuclease-1-like 5' DNA nuclease
MTLLNSRGNWSTDNQEVRMSKGKLIRVELQPGRFVKMYEADAAAQGLAAVPDEGGPAAKAQPPAQNKQRLPAQNKSAAAEDIPEEAAVEEADDLTEIPGVGPATARALQANGIRTFAQLRSAGTLDYLTGPANEALAAWRKSGG